MTGSRAASALALSLALSAAILFGGLRAPLLSRAGATRGWNSDHAVFGLMAKRLAERGEMSVWYWGQGYLGPLTPALAAPVRLALEGHPARGPLALRIAGFLELAAGILLFGLAFRRLFGPLPAALATLFLSAGPPFLLAAGVGTTNPGPEIEFVLSGAVAALAAPWIADPPRPVTAAFLLALGGLGGFGFWMHPGIVFVFAPVLLLLVLRSASWRELRTRMRVRDRLLFRAEALGWTIPPWARALALATEAWMLLRLLSVYLSPWLHTLLTPSSANAAGGALGVLAALHLAMAAPAAGSLVPSGARQAARRLVPFAAGFAAGYSPVLFRLLAGNPRGYTVELPLLPDSGFLPRLLEFPVAFLPAFLGLPSGAPTVAAALALCAPVAWLAWRRRARVRRLLALAPGRYAGAAWAALVVLSAFLFFLARPRNAEGLRYIDAAVPFAFALLAAGLVALARKDPWRLAAAGAMAVALVAFQVAGARGEVRRILSEPDPLALTREISARGYGVCYAGYWVAYREQFLCDETVRFIVYHGHDRNPAESDALRRLPGRKCLVTETGAVRDFTAEDELAQGGPSRRRRQAATSHSAR